MRAPERRPSLRSRRRNKRLVAGVALLVVFALLVFGVHYVSYLPRFSIQTIEVSGATRMPSDVLIEYVNSILDDGTSHFISRRNVVLYPSRALSAAIIANYPRIASATVSLAAPLSTTLVVSIDERTAYARWCAYPDTGSGCYYLDDQGVLFEDTSDLSESPSTPYLFSGGIGTVRVVGSTFAPGHLPGILTLMKYLTNAGFHPAGASVQTDPDFFVPLQEGFFIKASYGEDAQQLVKNLQLVLSSDALQGQETNLDYIDLRFGDRVYYKLKGQAEVSQ